MIFLLSRSEERAKRATSDGAYIVKYPPPPGNGRVQLLFLKGPKSGPKPVQKWSFSKSQNTCDFFVGIVVFLSMIFVMTPPAVSKPRDSGATSKSKTESALSFSPVDPDNIAA